LEKSLFLNHSEFSNADNIQKDLKHKNSLEPLWNPKTFEKSIILFQNHKCIR
jgi:hypothetical protein